MEEIITPISSLVAPNHEKALLGVEAGVVVAIVVGDPGVVVVVVVVDVQSHPADNM